MSRVEKVKQVREEYKKLLKKIDEKDLDSDVAHEMVESLIKGMEIEWLYEISLSLAMIVDRMEEKYERCD